MSQTKNLTITRRTMLAGSAAGAAVAGMSFGALGMANAAVGPSLEGVSKSAVQQSMSSKVCAAHHVELADHLKSLLNAAYVDENARNLALRSTNCPHCKVAIAPDMMDRAAFSIV